MRMLARERLDQLRKKLNEAVAGQAEYMADSARQQAWPQGAEWWEHRVELIRYKCELQAKVMKFKEVRI